MPKTLPYAALAAALAISGPALAQAPSSSTAAKSPPPNSTAAAPSTTAPSTAAPSTTPPSTSAPATSAAPPASSSAPTGSASDTAANAGASTTLTTGMSVKDNTGAIIGEVKALKGGVATITMGSDTFTVDASKLGVQGGTAMINASQADIKKMLPKK